VPARDLEGGVAIAAVTFGLICHSLMWRVKKKVVLGFGQRGSLGFC
jgi:hypothetical protein